MFKKGTNNLFIIAHPDDELFGIGGTILKLYQMKCNNYIILCTKVDTRMTSFNSVCKRLHIKENILLNATPYNIDKFILEDKIIKILKNFKERNIIFDNVFTHSKYDFHNDHQLVHDVVYLIFRPHNLNIKMLASFETYDSSNNPYSNFKPNLFINLSKDIVFNKIGLLEVYYSDCMINGRDKQTILAHMSRYGGMNNEKYAEAFQIIRMIY